jgi:dolichol-phosphate mannosyltransferase
LQALPITELRILVVDDNSPDGTGLIAESLHSNYANLQVIHRPRKLGLGTAYVVGFQHALKTDVDSVIQMDCDLSHEPETIPHMLTALGEADVIVGSRYVPGGELEATWGLHRKMLSACANAYARTLLGAKASDMTGDFKCWRRRALERMELESIRSNGYAFQIEMAHRAQQLGLRIREIPIRFFERNGGVSKMSASVIFEAAWRVCVLRIRPWSPRSQDGDV